MNYNMEFDKSEIDKRDIKQLEKAFDEAAYVLNKSYQYELDKYQVIKISQKHKSIDIVKNTRFFHVESIAYDKNEDNMTKLSNVYTAMSSVSGSLILILDSMYDKVNFYVGIKTALENEIYIAHKTLEKALKGNFPGCIINNQSNANIEKIIANIFKFRDKNSSEEHRVISSVNCISNLSKITKIDYEKEYSKGIEKLIDSMRGEVYTLVLVADLINQKQITKIRYGYEQLYTKLTPFASADISLGCNKGQTLTDSITKGTAEGITSSLMISQNVTHTTSKSKTNSLDIGISKDGISGKTSKSKTDTNSDSYSETASETNINSVSKTINNGISNAITMGKSENLLIKTQDKSINNLLKKIDIQLERLDMCSDLGMWNCGVYFIADDIQTSRTAASTYQALIRGESSGIEPITINTWNYDEDNEFNRENYFNITNYLKNFEHPCINIGKSINGVMPTSLISTLELTIQAGFPQKSIPGLTVFNHETFGRQVLKKNNNVNSSAIELGKIHHMGIDEALNVDIDIQTLSEHTFIAGSTGSGKSNTVYKLIGDLKNKNIPFLIIEPAKGEYKNIWGNTEGINVFGTNGSKMPLLKINPFKFPKDIHVLEHVDRLIEIFNVCWPMYAAMPAVLKDAVLQTYEVCGWNLLESKNEYSGELFPTFQDLQTELINVIENSAYSQELKSNYIGSLATRVKSLTNGLNGQIFSSDELDNNILFDKNVIVDLSRVGSLETKALIMGILIMRLNEHRMTFTEGMNITLKHVTVLEEAHNILKRTSTEQNLEGSNLTGKSVEMLSNAIAEMRTYGEGFIIVDQSPSAVDISAIRNTNTKIIMRLPDETDRRLVGKAAALKDEQLDEIAKLPKGVAVVYQNDWLEPVLCKINKYNANELLYEYNGSIIYNQGNKNIFLSELLKLLLRGRNIEQVEVDIELLNKLLGRVNLSTKNKIGIHFLLKEYINTGELDLWKDENFDKLSELVVEILECKVLVENIVRSVENFKVLTDELCGIIEKSTVELNKETILAVCQCLLKDYSKNSNDKLEIYAAWRKHIDRGVLL